ncbi:MAG: c-type cytochrome, partial [Chitinophagaceae bacterium]
NLLQTLDCKNCHLQDKRSIGPSFSEVALRYKKDPKADDYLTDKIIRGGGGVWGETPMAAHPNLDRGDAKLIVRWIRSLAEQGMARNWPPAGKLPASLIQPNKENGLLTITATYTDPGGNDIKPMTGTAYRILRNSKLNLSTVRKMNNFSSMTYNGMNLFISPVNSGWLAIPEADLTSITGVTLQTGWQKAPLYGYDFELRLDTPDGTLLAKSNLPGGLSSKGTNGATEVKFTWNPVTDGKKHEVYLVATAKKGPEANPFAIRGIEFKSAN